MIHPLFCFLGVSLSFGLSFILYFTRVLDYKRHFYAPILLLIAFYTVYSMLSDKIVYQKRSYVEAMSKGVCRYIVWGLVIYGVIWFYKTHPFYITFTPNTRVFLQDFFNYYLWIGLPYFVLEEKFRYCTGNFMGDHYMKLAVIVRCLYRRQFDRIRKRVFSRQIKRSVLTAILRIHYLPIMVEQVYFGVTNITEAILKIGFKLEFFVTDTMNTTFFTLPSELKADFSSYSGLCILLLAMLAWLIDSNNASIGYFWGSWFTKTRFREVDPHPMHWFVVVMCYPPFIKFATSFLAYFPSSGILKTYKAYQNPTLLPQQIHLTPLFESIAFNVGIDIALVTSLLLYMLSGCSLAFGASNLSYKKIQTKGPYRYMRHPATTFKLIFFTLSFYRFGEAFHIDWFLCYLFWMTVYILRTVIEERFLRQFPEYQLYMKQTKYRIIPGVI